MPKRKNRLPQMKPKVVDGQTYGILYLDGKSIFLGHFDDPKSQTKCDRLVSQWLANGRSLPQQPLDDEVHDITVVELVAHHRRWKLAQQGPQENLPYLKRRKAETPGISATDYACRVLLQLFEDVPVRQFGPDQLELVRAEMIRLDWTRGHINQQVQRLKAVFSYAMRCKWISADDWPWRQSSCRSR